MQMLLQSSRKILVLLFFALSFSLLLGSFVISSDVANAQDGTNRCSSASQVGCERDVIGGDCRTNSGSGRTGSCQPFVDQENTPTPNCRCVPDFITNPTDPGAPSTDSGSGGSGFDLDDSIGLETISIPFFPQVSLPDSEYATFLSWASFAGGLFSIGLIVFWVFLILRAAFTMLKSEGHEEMVADSISRLKSVFIGAALAILFPIGLSVLGSLLGLGNLWSWPAAFRDCPGTDSNYYYQEVLKLSDEGVADEKAVAESNCF